MYSVKDPNQVSASEGTSGEDLHDGCVRYGGSAVAIHDCQSGVDEVVEDEMARLATRLCSKKAKK
jgi:hypothetical protein